MHSSQSDSDSRLARLLRRPWFLCGLLSLAGVLAAVPALSGQRKDDLLRLGLGASFGLCIGLLIVIEAKRGISRIAKVCIQTLIGGSFGMVLALLEGFDLTKASLSIVVGLILGASAKYWIDHVNLP